MNDLISRQAAIAEAYNVVIDGSVFKVVQVETLYGLPTIEPKRGKWKEDIGGFSCTVCGYHTDDDEIGNWDITFGRWKYCPSCGARMERSEE